jgi:hypothetical protein
MDSFVHVHPHPQRTMDTEGDEGRQGAHPASFAPSLSNQLAPYNFVRRIRNKEGARVHRVHALLQLLAVCQKGQGHQALHPVLWPRALLSASARARAARTVLHCPVSAGSTTKRSTPPSHPQRTQSSLPPQRTQWICPAWQAHDSVLSRPLVCRHICSGAAVPLTCLRDARDAVQPIRAVG